MAKKRGPISKAVRNLCSGTLFEPVNKSAFKEGLRDIISEYPSALLQIGMAIQGWVVEYRNDKKDDIWRVTDEVEPLIRQEYEKWSKSFFETQSSANSS